MKKILCVLLSMLMLLSLTACAAAPEEATTPVETAPETTEPIQTTASTEAPTEPPTEETAANLLDVPDIVYLPQKNIYWKHIWDEQGYLLRTDKYKTHPSQGEGTPFSYYFQYDGKWYRTHDDPATIQFDDAWLEKNQNRNTYMKPGKDPTTSYYSYSASGDCDFFTCTMYAPTSPYHQELLEKRQEIIQNDNENLLDNWTYANYTYDDAGHVVRIDTYLEDVLVGSCEIQWTTIEIAP